MKYENKHNFMKNIRLGKLAAMNYTLPAISGLIEVLREHLYLSLDPDYRQFSNDLSE
jgi:hypothetical protein